MLQLIGPVNDASNIVINRDKIKEKGNSEGFGDVEIHRGPARYA